MKTAIPFPMNISVIRWLLYSQQSFAVRVNKQKISSVHKIQDEQNYFFTPSLFFHILHIYRVSAADVSTA